MSGKMPRGQILFFSGCPHYQAACELLRRIADDLHVDLEIELIEILDVGAADELRFLGSPSVRVDGRDVENVVSMAEAATAGRAVFGDVLA